MNEKNLEYHDLLWSCFVNWVNTLENALKIKLEKSEAIKEQSFLE